MLIRVSNCFERSGRSVDEQVWGECAQGGRGIFKVRDSQSSEGAVPKGRGGESRFSAYSRH